MANGLCHACFSSNELITLDKKGLPKCEVCHEKEITRCGST
jgi:hypothetical protein